MDDTLATPNHPKNAPGIEAKRRLIFGDFEFHPSQKILIYKSSPCQLDSKMLDLLNILIERRPNLVSKEELMSRLWPDAEVSDWSLARLVSDTRKLIEDDGKSQSIIKTIRGKGFSFAANIDEIIEAYADSSKSNLNDNSQTQESSFRNKAFQSASEQSGFNSTNNGDFRLAWISSILFLVAAALLIFYSRSGVDDSSNIAQVVHESREHRVDVMRKIQTNLKLTKTAFVSQLRRRNAFSEKMLSQKPELEQLTWEQRFRAYYPVMDKDERFVFDQIKAVTDGPLLQGNSAILDLLEAHLEMYIELPLFQALNSHLAIWKSKYEKVYQNREDLPIVYVGVEDGVPFPSEIDAQVDEWLTKHSKD